MALYLIGDVQGCNNALGRLLEKIGFSPSRDTIYLLGDLVNRGSDSACVVRRLMGYGAAAQCILGNHDLHCLAVANGIRPAHASDTLSELLAAPDREAMLDWLRYRPLALFEHGVLMVHAGVLPQWSATQTIAYSAELAGALRQIDYLDFLRTMYGNLPDRWSGSLAGADRLRVIVNALTRLRFCTAEGRMEFSTHEAPGAAPTSFMPWFEVPGRATADVTVAFGHWASLGLMLRPRLLGLDTGCVWGRQLSALRLAPQSADRELIQVEAKASA